MGRFFFSADIFFSPSPKENLFYIVNWIGISLLDLMVWANTPE